jgi:hypothetical protein
MRNEKGNCQMYDPNLHLFLNDDKLMARQGFNRMIQTPRRETTEPVLAANGLDEGTAIGYSSIIYDPESYLFKIWYFAHKDGLVRQAVSPDGLNWQRKGFVLSHEHQGRCDNLCMTAVGKRVDPCFRDSKFVGYCYFVDEIPGHKAGLHIVSSRDGDKLQVKMPGILPGVGDRSSLMYDEIADEYSLMSRPGLKGFREGDTVKPRMANLWKSTDLVNWKNHGVVLRYDDEDPADVEIYGMQPFRYGSGFLAFVEIYHAAIERLDTQLAWSPDAIHWQRVGGRQPFITLGGEGSWDSHWVVPTFNPPILKDDRYWIYYIGAGTKHGSGMLHKRAIGLASIRKDGWISLEAGRSECRLVTQPLPLEKPMKLELNVTCPSGYVSAEIISTLPGQDAQPIPGYEAEKSRTEKIDSVRYRVTWNEKKAIEPIEGERCYLRLALYQGSLFSYRWSEND